MGMLSIALYGICIGIINENKLTYVLASSLIWVETASYLILFGSISFRYIEKLIKYIIYYSILAGIISIFLFWSIRDEIAIAALVGGERIVRLTDLQAPLILIYVLFRVPSIPINIRRLAIFIFGLIILLGFFRSVWAAFILAGFVYLLIFPKYLFNKKIIISILFCIISIPLFEYAFFILTDIPAVISGRVGSGIGTADSLGRLSSSTEVLKQFSNDMNAQLFGGGFGKMVWFVNDFGYGEVRALQPVGSLSNFFIAFLYQVGIIFFFFVFVPILLLAKKYWAESNIDIKKFILFISAYISIQWLTFPSTIHFPTTMTLALALALLQHNNNNISEKIS